MKLQWIGSIALAGVALGAGGQATSAPPQILQFSLDRPGPPLTQYTLTVTGDGTGIYTPHLLTTVAESAPATQGDSRPLRVSAAEVKKLFAAVPMVLGGRCETHAKSIAQTGTKVLRFQGASRSAECTFNYSDDQRVNDAAADFQAISETMLFGDRLRAKLRFDRLGLDNELDQLVTAVGDGRALEVGNIASVLQAIQDDERVMERARRKATRLLESAQPAQTAAGSASASNPR